MDNHRAVRVLCVEDDDNIRSNAVEALRDAGFEVLEAHNGDCAMDLIADPDSVDIVFTDVAMPGKWDGVDLVEQIRRQHPTMPVIVTSGYAAHLQTRLRKLSPPTVFISKPYMLSEIVRTMEKLTGHTASE
jgi:DNA-binding NtrC family response regulator